LALRSARSRKPHSAQPPDVRIAIDAFRAVVQALRTTSRDAEKRVGVSAAQLFALHELASRSGASINDLAVRTFTHQSSVSVVVQRLVDRRLVMRRPAADDRRRVELELTTAGRAILRRAPEPVQQRLIAAIHALPPRRRAVFAQSLRDIAARVTQAATLPPVMFFEDSNHTSRGRRRR
jgi:DNA-binding MarR family transcriptional regulator